MNAEELFEERHFAPRLTRKRAPITFRHLTWDAPKIQTTDYCRACGMGGDGWTGELDAALDRSSVAIRPACATGRR